MKLCLVCNFQFEDEQELCPKDYSKLVPLGKDQLIGKLIQDRYRVESMIAKGSMGVVYKAIQELIGREVAIKVLHGYLVADEESIKRFHKEAKAASRLNHPNITTLYDYGVLSSGQPYIVMDLLRGNSLADVLKQRDYLPLDEAMVIFRQVCDALGEAHKRGVVHRDIKPENIMLEYTEKGVFVKVVDFGIAKFQQEQDDTIGKITKTGTVCGSPTYMSPEQCDDNRVDHRSDLYSLGVVIYETITGKVPFSGGDIYSVMTMHVKDAPPPLKSVRPDLDFPAYLQNVLNKALAKNPDERFQNAQEFWDGLQGKMAAAARVSTSQPMEVGAAVGARSSSGSISEEEVKNVIARSMEKRAQQQAQQAAASAEPEPAPTRPEIDPEFVRKTVQAATAELLSRKTAANIQVKEVKPKMRRNVTLGMRMFGLMQQVFPLFLTIALFGVLLVVVKDNASIHKMIDKQFPTVAAPAPEVESNDADDLIAQNKFEQARVVLEKQKKAGKLDADGVSTLNSVYIRLAKKEGKAKHFKAAVTLLDQVTGEDKDDDEVRALLKKYKHSGNIK